MRCHPVVEPKTRKGGQPPFLHKPHCEAPFAAAYAALLL